MKKTEIKMNKSILDISKAFMYEFWYDYINQSMEIEQHYVTLIRTLLLFMSKLKIFTKTLLIMLKDGSIHLI